MVDKEPEGLSRAERLTREIFGEKGPPVTPADETLLNIIFGEPVEGSVVDEEPISDSALGELIKEEVNRVVGSLGALEKEVVRFR